MRKKIGILLVGPSAPVAWHYLSSTSERKCGHCKANMPMNVVVCPTCKAGQN